MSNSTPGCTTTAITRSNAAATPAAAKALPVRFEGGQDGLWWRYFEMVDLSRRPSGDRHLGADDVIRFPGSVTGGLFCDYGQAGCARRCQFVWKMFGLALTPHAGIEMDLWYPAAT